MAREDSKIMRKEGQIKQMDGNQDPQSSFQDEHLVCIECGASFTFEVGEQKFYLSKLLMWPKRCSECRRRRKATINQERFHDR